MSSNRKIYALLLAAIFLLGSAFVFTRFLAFHEIRVDASGWHFTDQFMNLFPIADCSYFIFSITYGSMIFYAFLEYKKPMFASKLMFAYGLLMLVRIATLSLIPLKEPETLVYLQDPFLNNLIYPGDIETDLFFSGHSGLLFLMFFLSRKIIFLLLGLILGVFLMIQRVHYSIDILAAIPFAYIIVRSVEYIVRRNFKAR